MADITWLAKLTLIEGNVTVTNSKSQADQTRESTLTKLHHTIQNVDSTTAENLSLGDLSLAKEISVLLQNLDQTNYVEIEFHKDGSNLATVCRMRPNEFFLARLNAQSGGYPKIMLKANTAPCDVEIVAGEAGNPAA